MRFFVILFLILNTSFASTSFMEECADVAKNSNVVGILEKCLSNPAEFDLVKSIGKIDNCKHCEDNGEGESCRIDDESILKHCSKKKSFLCVNGHTLSSKEASAKQLYDFFCSDQDFPSFIKKKNFLALGSCSSSKKGDEIIAANEMKCECSNQVVIQGGRAVLEKNLVWKCYSPND